MEEETRASVPQVTGEAEFIYSFKPSMMSGGHHFRLAENGLDWEIGRYSGHIPYREIKRIRLSFRPVSLATHRFVAEIWSDKAPKLNVASTSWKSVVEQARQDAPYASFVRTLSRRVADAGAETAFETGANRFLYWPGVVMCALLSIALPWMLVRALQAGATGGAWVIVLLLLVFVWQIGNFFWRNRPGTYAPRDIPLHVLPRKS